MTTKQPKVVGIRVGEKEAEFYVDGKYLSVGDKRLFLNMLRSVVSDNAWQLYLQVEYDQE